MVRVLLFLIVVGLVALGFAWLADRPGDVTITWLGWRIETSLLVLTAALAVLTAGLLLVWSLLKWLLRSPRLISRARLNRRRSHAYQAISRGLIAIGAGDAGLARKSAAEASRLSPSEPLTLLLNAQTAQISGDRAKAENAFREMAARPDTRLLGLRGLYVEAQRRSDIGAARLYAEEAAKSSAALSWAGKAVFESRLAGGDWAGALDTLENSRRENLIEKAQFRRQRAVLLVARAATLGDSERMQRAMLATEATKLAPDLIPAAVLAGRFLAEGGEVRKAARILEASWQLQPHPDIAETYAYLKPGETARARLGRVQTLVRHSETSVESALAVARAAIDAHEFGIARNALMPFLAAPTKRIATLMAELEQAEHGDEGRSRAWMARALRAAPDPAWIADGYVSDRWLPVSPVSGRLDAFEWKLPVAQVTAEGSLIEQSERPPAIPIEAPAETVRHWSEIEAASESAEPAQTPVPLAERAERAASMGAASMGAASPPERMADPVIPLVHAPDDPGPDPEPNPVRPVDGRRGLRLFFR